MQKKCSMIHLILPSKAEEGWIKQDQCQVDSMWVELTYYIETLSRIRYLAWDIINGKGHSQTMSIAMGGGGHEMSTLLNIFGKFY